MGKIASSSSFLILKEDTLLYQSPHEMSPSLSEYHIATVGNILMVLMMISMMVMMVMVMMVMMVMVMIMLY